jgi:cohesin complex subunit SCC1
MPNTLTMDDLFNNADFDTSILQLSQAPIHGLQLNDNHDSSAMDWISSPAAESNRRPATEEMPQIEDDIELDIDWGENDNKPLDGDSSIEIGRNAPAPRPMDEDFFSDDNKILGDPDLELDNDDLPMADLMSNGVPAPHDDLNNFLGDENNVFGGDEFDLPADDNTGMPAGEDRGRRSQSQLSSVRSSVLRGMDDSREDDEVAVRQAQRAKKRKLIQPDKDTVLHNHQIKQQQADRSKILKPTSLLPRDPFLLTLMSMQRNGDFVSRAMGMRDGDALGLAPELRGILSIDLVRTSGEKKRKRDSGIADMGENAAGSSPRLEFDDQDQFGGMDEGLGLGGDSFHDKSTMIDLPAGDDGRPATRDSNISDDGGIAPNYDEFDDTTAPLVHPADNGPVSLGTKHAVHLLRDRFGGSASESPSQQKKASVLFHELLPETRTSKADATKMFFEVLVLATKDAVKVEQSGNDLGGPLRIRGKRGLWGSWAETEAGGEIATQGTQVAA